MGQWACSVSQSSIIFNKPTYCLKFNYFYYGSLELMIYAFFKTNYTNYSDKQLYEMLVNCHQVSGVCNHDHQLAIIFLE